MNYSQKQLIAICKEKGVKGYSNKKKEEIIEMLKDHLPKPADDKPADDKPADDKSADDKSADDKSADNNASSIKMIDLFAGTGAFTYAFTKTQAVECVFANDMVEMSKKAYDANFNHKLFLKDINDIDVKTIPNHSILTGGFPCFIAGTKVLTSDCYKNIEDVNLSDKLITHTGKSQDILNLQQKDFSGILYNIKIKYHGEIISCTPEHPFYVREQNKKWNNELRKYDYLYSEPQWITAEKLHKKCYFGMVINTKSEIPEFTFTQKINQNNTKEVTIKLDKPEYWYLMGYFIVHALTILKFFI